MKLTKIKWSCKMLAVKGGQWKNSLEKKSWSNWNIPSLSVTIQM